jgi:hypothetical protein
VRVYQFGSVQLGKGQEPANDLFTCHLPGIKLQNGNIIEPKLSQIDKAFCFTPEPMGTAAA